MHVVVGDVDSASIPGTTSGGSDDAVRIAARVAGHFTSRTVDGTTVHDLTDPR